MKKPLIIKIAALLFPALFTLAPVAVLAESISGEVNTGLRTPATSAEVRLKANANRSSAEIETRINALTALKTRLNAMNRVSASAKSSLSSSLDSTMMSLSALKARIAADASADVRTDLRTITEGTRVYRLVIPQTLILAAADRAIVIADMFTAFDAKITARIAEATKAGVDVSAMTSAQADMTAKVADAKLQAQAAITAVSNLSADNGDQAKLQANLTALKTGRTALAAAKADLVAAQKDMRTIINALRAAAKVSAEAEAQ